MEIHQIWVRQEVEASRLNVMWVPTDKIPADGLTKILPKQKFKEFIKQLGLVDIGSRLNGIKKISNHDLNRIYPSKA